MNKVYLGIITVLICVNVCFGQAENSNEEKRVVLMSGTNITAELQKTLDVNQARVGDEVVLKTSQTIKQNGEVAIPKGSRLIGRVTEVQRRTKDNARSQISMVFERIQGKELSLPLNATIVSITNAAASASLNDSLASDVSGSSQSSASTSSSKSGGGLLGGVGGAVGGVVNTATQTVDGVTNTAVNTASSTTGTVGRTVNGLQISAAANGSANSSTTLSSPSKNVRVDKGASFQLRVAN